MQAATEKKNKTKASKKAASTIKKMLEDKRMVSEHIRKGGSLEELEKKGYHFATV